MADHRYQWCCSAVYSLLRAHSTPRSASPPLRRTEGKKTKGPGAKWRMAPPLLTLLSQVQSAQVQNVQLRHQPPPAAAALTQTAAHLSGRGSGASHRAVAYNGPHMCQPFGMCWCGNEGGRMHEALQQSARRVQHAKQDQLPQENLCETPRSPSSACAARAHSAGIATACG